MDLYQLKSRVKYLSDEDVDFLTEEIAVKAIKEGLSIELVNKLTELGIERIAELKQQLDEESEE